ncbi:Gfo/Idh/MocA family protein [Aerococcus sanguinicola]|uniref:Gfo/Idh/MocA family protein n=1 Tax=unclassified Aerococcus TaxID=2618060 RepID=UPI0008A15F16|nr:MULTISPECIES: Gfo/Idh/MocA family oxidoreductase [unclassified Aerococcus]MDK6233536.1 Gfo/Idh/MocA family oxidoreductase [Aerococcus sp. UMB10185]MDK6856092.1 Gfo/Idh/MocA family oxidoreductase [Aerococcus sp. UMB7533]MDK8501534.1 Gfo/Idh/MocA family oxidoreductase [Aerococcus sp. UMB1112A]OFN01327.1 hypothetical protein HMPREF2626_07805 [Aerococcus sp. HMSC062A02]OHO46266.1 hypothetical protein HMPREF2705_09370 [Aerococcus sp. HMSC035B07]
MLKVGVVGLGTVSVVHLRAIENAQAAELTAVCDLDESLKTQAEGARFYTDLDKMLDQEDLDVVHICLPHYLHDEAALKCLKAGVHVFLEKPVTIDAERTRELLAAQESLDNNAKLAICFQNRLNATVQELKRILTEDDTSPVIAVKGIVAWYRPEDYYIMKPWRGREAEAGAGTIINQSIHTLDLMHYVTDTDWLACRGMLGNLMEYDIEVEDSAMANYKLSDGSHGFFAATNAYYGNDSIELQVVTQKTRYTIKDDKLFDDQMNCLAENESLPGTKIYYGPSHQRCIENFYQAIIDGTDNYCQLSDALTTMEMIDAMKASSKTKQTIYKGDI